MVEKNSALTCRHITCIMYPPIGITVSRKVKVSGYIGIAWLMDRFTDTILPISEFSMYTEMPPMQVLHTEALGGAGLHNIQIQYKPVRSVGYKCG